VNNTGEGRDPGVFWGSYQGCELTDVVFRDNSCPPIGLERVAIAAQYTFILLRCVFDQPVESNLYTMASGDNLTVTDWAPTITIMVRNTAFCSMCTYCADTDAGCSIQFTPPSLYSRTRRLNFFTSSLFIFAFSLDHRSGLPRQ
jgi:hypothetical protein